MSILVSLSKFWTKLIHKKHFSTLTSHFFTITQNQGLYNNCIVLNYSLFLILLFYFLKQKAMENNHCIIIIME